MLVIRCAVLNETFNLYKVPTDTGSMETYL